MDVPGQVRTAQVIEFIKAGLGVLAGIFLVIIGVVASSQSGGVNAGTDTGHALGIIGGLVVAIGVIALIISALIIWAAVYLGRLSHAARIGITVLESINIVFGVIGLTKTSILGVLNLALSVLILYLLWWNAPARSAFSGYGRLDDQYHSGSTSPWGQ